MAVLASLSSQREARPSARRPVGRESCRQMPFPHSIPNKAGSSVMGRLSAPSLWPALDDRDMCRGPFGHAACRPDLLLVGPARGVGRPRRGKSPGIALEQGRVLDHRQHTQRDASAVVLRPWYGGLGTGRAARLRCRGRWSGAEVQAGADAAPSRLSCSTIFSLNFLTSCKHGLTRYLGCLQLKQCGTAAGLRMLPGLELLPGC